MWPFKKRSGSDWMDLGFVKLRVVSSSDAEDVVSLKPIEPNSDGAAKANMAEYGYISSKKCSCGGEWTKEGSSSAYPLASIYCRCAKCDAEKKFTFRFIKK